MEKYPHNSTWHLPACGTARWLVARTGWRIRVVWLLWRELCLFWVSHLYLSAKSWAHCLEIALRWDRMKQAVDIWAIRAISDGDVRQYRLSICFTVINVYHLKYNKGADARLLSDISPPASHCCSFSISHFLSREDKYWKILLLILRSKLPPWHLDTLFGHISVGWYLMVYTLSWDWKLGVEREVQNNKSRLFTANLPGMIPCSKTMLKWFYF